VCDSWRWPFFILHFPRIKHPHRAITSYHHLNFVPFCLRVKTDARQSPFANFAPLRETLARQYFRRHRLCIRDIRVIRGQPSHPGSLARQPFVPFCLRVKRPARQSPFANFAPLRETLARQYFRSHRLCIRDIRVIRGQPSHPGSLARPPFVPFCLRVKPDPRQSPLTANR
jgi:hypothetical protein